MDIQSLKSLLFHNVEEESINHIISKTPLVYPLDNSNAIKVGNYYLPYSVGFEIECFKGDDFNIDSFLNIPDIMDVDITEGEQRFRIPPGFKGLHCLYNISTQLKLNSLLNPDSGIHYHIDCTDVYHLFNYGNIGKNEKWILEELSKWGYKGTYNLKSVRFDNSHRWVRFQPSFKTAEFRIGEMTFDYDVLFVRIAHCCKIIEKLKANVTRDYNETLKERAVLDYPILNYNDDINNVLENRIKKI